jgi:hypothetical protein
MTLHLIGILTIIAGGVAMVRGHAVLIAVMIAMAVFGGAAALYLNSNDVGPAQLLLAFTILSLLVRPSNIGTAIAQAQPFRPGFWLVCFVIYAVMSSFFLPRMLAGRTDVVPLAIDSLDMIGVLVPLGPVSSNFTQSVYLMGNCFCFLLVAGAASTRTGFRTVIMGVLAYGVLNTLTALADLVTSAVGASSLLDVIRTARYTFLNEAQAFGMKRIVGAFPEASSFARSTMGVLGFTATLWLCGRYKRITGPLALLSLLAVTLSTSSSGLAVMPVMLLVLLFTAVGRSGGSQASLGGPVLIVFGAIAVAVVAGSATLLNSQISETISSYADELVFSKMETTSGIERSSWNATAFQNVADTYGFGVGLGTNRVSSFAIALLSNVGVIGVVLYAVFMSATFLRNAHAPRTYPHDIKLAARNAAFGLLATDLLISSTVDQGILFYAIAGLMAAQPDTNPVREPVANRGLKTRDA